MSYDIGLHKIHDGDIGVCSAEEAQACVDLLKSVNTNAPDEFNFVILEFDDGSSVEVSLWDNEKAITGCTFFTRGISLSILEFIYHMAAAGNFVIIDTQGSDTPESPIGIMTSRDVLENVGSDSFANPRLCTGFEELVELFGVTPDDTGRGGPLIIEVPQEALQKPKPQSFFKRLFSRK